MLETRILEFSSFPFLLTFQIRVGEPYETGPFGLAEASGLSYSNSVDSNIW